MEHSYHKQNSALPSTEYKEQAAEKKERSVFSGFCSGIVQVCLLLGRDVLSLVSWFSTLRGQCVYLMTRHLIQKKKRISKNKRGYVGRSATERLYKKFQLSLEY